MEAHRKSMVNVGLIVIVCGAVVTVLASGVSREPIVLTFGIGPMMLGLLVLSAGFFGRSKKADKPVPRWKTLLATGTLMALVFPRVLFDYRVPHWLRPYIMVAVAIIDILVLWPVRPTEQKS